MKYVKVNDFRYNVYIGDKFKGKMYLSFVKNIWIYKDYETQKIYQLHKSKSKSAFEIESLYDIYN